MAVFCTAIVVAGGSWISISGVRVTMHLISTFLLQELDQVALDFTLTRLCWPPSAALGLAIDGPELGRHRRSLDAIGGARPPSAELGHRRRSLAAICGVRPPSAELIRLRRRSAATCGTRPPSAALGLHRRRLDAICGTRPDRRLRSLAAICGARQCSAASGGPRRLASTTLGPCAGIAVVGQP
jgi:hypothetical protein